MSVYYICPANSQEPYGGVLVLYRHVDVLNSAGIPAKLVHGLSGFRSDWFENETAIAYPPLQVTDSDLLAVPEVLNPALNTLAPGIPKVSINQNAYYTFDRTPLSQQHAYRACPDLLGVLCVSEDSQRNLMHAFPDLDLQRVYYSYGGPEFRPPAEPKRKQIAYMPRKRGGDIHAVISILQARGVVDEWQLVPIENMARTQVAETLRRSALFLSTSDHEGFGMPPVEAMACGCFVIGYTGFGGSEFFDPRFTIAVPDSDIYAFARIVETWLGAWDPASAVAAGQAAADYIRGRYSHEAERTTLVAAFEHFLAKMPAPSGVQHVLQPGETWLEHQRPISNRRRAARHMKDAVLVLRHG